MAIRIGAAQGFSGDDLRGTREIVEDGVDYICCEALAEITLTSMYRERRADETHRGQRERHRHVRVYAGNGWLAGGHVQPARRV